MKTVAVIDYGASNLRSVVKALEWAASGRHQVLISDEPETILAADRIVFPGQGAIRQCMEALQAKHLDQVLLEALNLKPFLGVCLGLQSLMTFSEEDHGTGGLGIIPGKVVKFREGERDETGTLCKIPHMGWNMVEQRIDHPMWKGIPQEERFYFVHSYYVVPDDANVIVGTTSYMMDFTCAIAKENLFAVQFHPEKSQRAGLMLLSNFLEW